MQIVQIYNELNKMHLNIEFTKKPQPVIKSVT